MGVVDGFGDWVAKNNAEITARQRRVDEEYRQRQEQREADNAELMKQRDAEFALWQEKRAKAMNYDRRFGEVLKRVFGHEKFDTDSIIEKIMAGEISHKDIEFMDIVYSKKDGTPSQASRVKIRKWLVARETDVYNVKDFEVDDGWYVIK